MLRQRGHSRPAQGRLLHDRERHGAYPRGARSRRRRICDEALRPRDAAHQASARRRRLSVRTVERALARSRDRFQDPRTTTPPHPADDRRRFDGRTGGAVADDRERSRFRDCRASPEPPRTRSRRSGQVPRRHRPPRPRDARRRRAQVHPAHHRRRRRRAR